MTTKKELPKDFYWGQIYKITGPDERVYIGQTKKYLSGGKERGYLTRWKQHVNDAKLTKEGRKSPGCTHLVHALNAYDASNFTIEVLLECKIEYLDEFEIYYIQYYDSTNSTKGYNISKGGRSVRLPKINFDKNLKLMIAARRIITFQELSVERKTELQEKLEYLSFKYPPLQRKNSPIKILPRHIRELKCKRGYTGYLVQISDFDIKNFRSGFSCSLDEALNNALDYLSDCMKCKEKK